jgi:hypothetical protein
MANKTAVKKTAKKILNKEEIKSSKKVNGKFILNYNITAYAQKEKDNSDASIFEWFDSGREIDAIACPFDYKKMKKIFEVVWQGAYSDPLKIDVIEDAISQIKYWANIYEASFQAESSIILKDNKGKIIKTYSFEKDSWEA